MKYTSELLTLYAGTLVLIGVALLFMPEGFSMAMNYEETAAHALFAQLLGAAFIGFAASNWIVRHAPVGGIYGRAVVLGNQAFSLVGALALIGGFPARPGPAVWVLLVVFAGGAVLHGMLLLRGPQLSGS
ncbi:hypothetical protein [Salisaeta longa]|uniref:hypothetical protein n=1 Tax=Salisaeta longa TaxID=503170 RepID=UPI0003B4F0D7|nr:hypothetical protein [Salisaeta longa]